MPKPPVPTHRTCRDCKAKIWLGNKSGWCRRCHMRRTGQANTQPRTDHLNTPETKAKAAEASRRAFKHRPELREKQRAQSAKFNRTPEARQRSAMTSKLSGAMAKARAARRPEHFAKLARSRSEAALADIPPEQRELYRELTRVKRIPAADARALVMAKHEADMARIRRRLEQQADEIEHRRERETC